MHFFPEFYNNIAMTRLRIAKAPQNGIFWEVSDEFEKVRVVPSVSLIFLDDLLSGAINPDGERIAKR
jgi:hypothetical protein